MIGSFVTEPSHAICRPVNVMSLTSAMEILTASVPGYAEETVHVPHHATKSPAPARNGVLTIDAKKRFSASMQTAALMAETA